MITVEKLPSGAIKIAAAPGGIPYDTLSALREDSMFTGEKSELSIATPASESEEFNEDWEEYALSGVISAALSWSEKFQPVRGALCFMPNEVPEVAGMINRARLKIAMEGTGDILPPSPTNPRYAQYEFLTALLEFVTGIPRETEPPPES